MVTVSPATVSVVDIPVVTLRQTASDKLVPGTHRVPVDKDEGVDERMAAQFLASQETSAGVFRYLPDGEKALAEHLYDSPQPDAYEDKMSRLAALHQYRNTNMRNAVSQMV